MELDTKAKLEVTTAKLYEDMHNLEKQGEVHRLKHIMGEIDNRKARGAAIRSRVK